MCLHKQVIHLIGLSVSELVFSLPDLLIQIIHTSKVQLERATKKNGVCVTLFSKLFSVSLFPRGYLGVEDMTVAKSCRLFLALTGSTELANSEGTYGFHSLTVADGGEVTSTPDVSSNSLTLDIDDVAIQGGGMLHMVRIRILAGNFTVDDQGHVRGDTFDNRFVLSETSPNYEFVIGQCKTQTAECGLQTGDRGYNED